MSSARRKLCVLVPARNCAPFLPELVRRTPLAGLNDEVIAVDDESSDSTLEVARALPRTYAERNATCLGYGGTSKKLYDIALRRHADFAVNIHGDLAHPPEIAAEITASSSTEVWTVGFLPCERITRSRLAGYGA